jgi:hypothetical protein
MSNLYVDTIQELNIGQSVTIKPNLSILGNVTTTGLINGIDITTLGVSQVNTVNIIPRSTKFKNTSYMRAGTIVYDGTGSSQQLSKVCFISSQHKHVTNHSVRILDLTNDQIIGEKLCTNTTEQVNIIDVISNLPSIESIFEVQVKKTGGKGNQVVYLESVTFFY